MKSNMADATILKIENTQ